MKIKVHYWPVLVVEDKKHPVRTKAPTRTLELPCEVLPRKKVSVFFPHGVQENFSLTTGGASRVAMRDYVLDEASRAELAEVKLK